VAGAADEVVPVFGTSVTTTVVQTGGVLWCFSAQRRTRASILFWDLSHRSSSSPLSVIARMVYGDRK
jgi:hypothetical protein